MDQPAGGLAMAPLRRRYPALALQYPQSLGAYDDYDDAQRVVDYLSDKEFPVQNCMIVGTELKQVERVTGRLTYPRAAAAGASSGAWFGLLIGLILGLFAPEDSWFGSVVGGLLIGAAFGLVWGLVGYHLSGGRRDFTSVTRVVATKYEVLVEHNLLAQAQELLGPRAGI
jgi:hypothetical protein